MPCSLAVGARRPRLPQHRAEQAASAEPGAQQRSRAGTMDGEWERARVGLVAVAAERCGGSRRTGVTGSGVESPRGSS